MVILMMIAFAIIAFAEIPKLIYKKYWPELVVFSILFFISFSLSMLVVLGYKLPYFSSVIEQNIKRLLSIK